MITYTSNFRNINWMLKFVSRPFGLFFCEGYINILLNLLLYTRIVRYEDFTMPLDVCKKLFQFVFEGNENGFGKGFAQVK